MRDRKDAAEVRAALRKIVRTQLRTGEPPETRETYERLLADGIAETEVWNLLTAAVGAEVFDTLIAGRSFDEARLRARLLRLPDLPDDPFEGTAGSGAFSGRASSRSRREARRPAGRGKRTVSLLQCKITLKRIRPPIWRRIQVPDTVTFWDLHVAIQDAMGWTDTHRHEFQVRHPRTGHPLHIGLPEGGDEAGDRVGAGWSLRVSRYLSPNQPKMIYRYDFADGWEHEVVLERRVSDEAGCAVQRCVGGRRRCPPEDCGGPQGYRMMLKVLADTDHPERESYLQWAGEDFDPESFDPSQVVFSDPEERLARVREAAGRDDDEDRT